MPNPSLVAFPGRLTITDANGAPCPGAKLHIAGKVIGPLGGEGHEPQQVTPLQMRRALRKLGLLDQVNAYVQSQSVDVQDSWQYCIGFPRNDPMIVAAATALNVDLDALFALAATFP